MEIVVNQITFNRVKNMSTGVVPSKIIASVGDVVILRSDHMSLECTISHVVPDPNGYKLSVKLVNF